MKNWKLVETEAGLRMEQVEIRAIGEKQFTWAHLLYGKLGTVKVGIFYFPSRFDDDTDKAVIGALRAFGKNTGATTSVNIWDTKDPELKHALELFGLKVLPAVVFATGLQVEWLQPCGPDKTPLYSIIQEVSGVLSDKARFQSAVNTAHEVLLRSDSNEIAAYIKAQTPAPILSAIEKIASNIRCEILKWKPKFVLPGGTSVQVG